MVAPVPAIAPGLMVQVPVAGSPFRTTLPVGTAHEVGCVTVPIIGAAGATGAALITTLAEANDIHPASLVTVKVWLPGARFEIVVVVPVPVIPPGLIVQTPVAGRALNATLPVAAVHEAG